MKKNLVRVLALALVLIMALGIIPLGALAIEPDKIFVPELAFDKTNPSAFLGADPFKIINIQGYDIGSTIKASNYESHLTIGDDFYDFKGFFNSYDAMETVEKKLNNYWASIVPPAEDASEEEISKFYDDLFEGYEKIIKNTGITFSKNNIKIEPYPTMPVAPDPNKYADSAAYDAAMKVYDVALKAYDKACTDWENTYMHIIAGYTPHQHKLSYWYSDSTTHWRECLVCRDWLGQYEQFMNQNWHSDGDEDRICDVCGADIPYHEVKVIDSKGGKITVNLDEAPHRKKITATVEVEDGYKLKKLHFTKVRTDGSKQEITRYKKNGEYYTLMPTYDLEVTAEYVKK